MYINRCAFSYYYEWSSLLFAMQSFCSLKFIQNLPIEFARYCFCIYLLRVCAYVRVFFVCLFICPFHFIRMWNGATFCIQYKCASDWDTTANKLNNDKGNIYVCIKCLSIFSSLNNFLSLLSCLFFFSSCHI